MLINPLGLFQICDPWLKNKENRICFYKKIYMLYETGSKYPAKDKYSKGGS